MADAYIGAGDLDAARKALEDGLAATGDAEIQARLDELSAEAGNLTGQPPFSFQDLEDWGYPYGVDVYELMANGNIIKEDYSEWISKNLEECQNDIKNGEYEGNRGGTILRRNNPSIAVWNTLDMNIMSVEIEEGDTCTGPRGLCLGSVYLGNGSHYEDGVLIKERRTVLSYDIIDWATLYVEITDGTVSQIDVCYWS